MTYLNNNVMKIYVHMSIKSKEDSSKKPVHYRSLFRSRNDVMFNPRSLARERVGYITEELLLQLEL